MDLNEIRSMAKGVDIKTHGMKKPDIIRAIQRKENNSECYGTIRLRDCSEFKCLWRTDCIASNGKGSG